MVFRSPIFLLLLAPVLLLNTKLSHAQSDINLLPKYGLLQKADWQKVADENFVSGMDERYHGDRTKASIDTSARGWQYLMQHDQDDAMRRFNQAWLLDSNNGYALWGMAAVEGSFGKLDESLKLFAEAEKFVGGEINFSVDYAKALGTAAAMRNDNVMLKDALNRYEDIYKKAPQNTNNLQNWAIILFAKQRYPEAWAKIKLAEATPDKSQIDPRFVADLEAHMPRPKD